MDKGINPTNLFFFTVKQSSCRSILLHILSDLMTLREHFGYLNGLKYAWIGSACPALNTCLAVAPLLGIDVNYLCRCGGEPLTPSNLKELQDTDIPQYTAKIHEAASLEQALSDANVVSINNPVKVDIPMIMKTQIDKLAHENWVFFHLFPRKPDEVDEEIFINDKNLVWKSFANSKWICAAIVHYLLNSAVTYNVNNV
ncbi:unnamed protein product [Acanthoscelides obtectus]|uniref:ornithine carbamoyltransferase n=1 Tax=Acanthoscelides obtectus TaxID=200917 RepID=A0A9P0JWU0_ACAOB|nr:unnamed protein product [Acanthoscelides obtectus]CAH2008777.1 unnamed protein product [Acanthoscelides obtectus]CAK1648869.1 Ornithine carbamoyltransferase, mitochondrial [Acanthoscelides obtectus]CAK1648889.1 Ornithine carbamoyltransferase, mitochondrial [Acanthoscelides obtectus]